MGTTIRDIAARCGIDISTVSRGLRGDPRVKPETQERIHEAAKELAYSPNLAARHLVNGRTNILWFLLSSLSSSIQQWPAQAAGQYLSVRGYDLLCALYHGEGAVLSRLSERMAQGLADGAFIIPHIGADSKLFQHLIERDFPLICVDRGIDGLEVPIVTNENAESSMELIRRCHNEGCRSFIVLYERHDSSGRERHEAALSEIDRLKCDCILPFESSEPFSLPPASAPVAILGSAQFFIAEFISAHRELGRRELCFGSYDSWVGSAHPARKAFVAVQDFDAIARRASDLMLQWLVERRCPGQRLIRVPVKEFKVVDA